MKNVFVETANVKAFLATATSLESREAGVPGLALVHGNRGLGKTRTAIWYAAGADAVYLRAKSVWSPSWLLEELAVELGVTPRKRKRDLFEDVANALKERPRLTIVDEVNLPQTACLECLRDLHDVTDSPFLLIGHEGVVPRLKRLGPLFDRFLYITEFKALTLADLRAFAASCLDLPAEDAALEKVLAAVSGNFRKAIVALKGMEGAARANRHKSIGPELFRRAA